MAFAITIQGTVKDQGQNPIAGITVELFKEVGLAIDSDVTDATGFYSVSASSDSHGADIYHADAQGLSPHYSNPAAGPGHSWGAASNNVYTDNFTTTFTNVNPTRSTVGNQTFEEDDGTKTITKTMGDADAGDVLTPVKLSGASWGTLSKVSSTQYRWSFNTGTPAPGEYTFSYRIDDNFGGSSPSESFEVTITEANQPPVFTTPGTIRFEQNSGLRTFQLVASDPEGGAVTFEKDTGQTWATVDVNTGLVTVDTAAAAQGSFNHIWTAHDPDGGETSRSHLIEILEELLIGPYYQVA